MPESRLVGRRPLSAWQKKRASTWGYTVPGVQKKLSLHLLAEGKPRLTMMNYPTGYILKPQVKEFTALPESGTW